MPTRGQPGRCKGGIGMRKVFVAAATVAIFALLASPAIGAPGGGGGSSKIQATISFLGGETARTAPSQGGEVAFGVDPVGIRDRDLYKLWVGNVCTQDGLVVSVQHEPVSYSSFRVGSSGDFTLASDTWVSGGASCTAYVWMHPAVGVPLVGGSMSYGVSS